MLCDIELHKRICGALGMSPDDVKVLRLKLTVNRGMDIDVTIYPEEYKRLIGVPDYFRPVPPYEDFSGWHASGSAKG